jgi:hypothetical protein
MLIEVLISRRACLFSCLISTGYIECVFYFDLFIFPFLRVLRYFLFLAWLALAFLHADSIYSYLTRVYIYQNSESVMLKIATIPPISENIKKVAK